MTKLLLTLLLILALPLAAWAADLAPRDFAYGLTLEMDQDAPLYQVDMPQSIYESVTDRNLGDIRVFNQQGEVVPHTLWDRRPETIPAASPAPVPLFPLYGPVAEYSRTLSMQVITDHDGIIVQVGTAPDLNGAAVTAYILDASQLEPHPDQLEILWPANTDNLVMNVDLDVSQDLSRWSRLVSGAALADISFQGNRLIRRQIQLPEYHGRYLRLSWPGHARNLAITGIRALFPTSPPRSPRLWKTLSAGAPEKPNEYLFDTGGFFPVDSLEILPPQRNTLSRATLFSRDLIGAPWQVVYSGLVYNLEVDGHRLYSDTIRQAPNADRFYKLQVDSEGGGLGAGLPEMKIGWTRQQLYFVARGQGPYTLAYGNAAVFGETAPLDPLLGRLEHQNDSLFIKPARLGSPVELGGPERLKKPIPPGLWKVYALWAVLVLGVLLLGAMAWRLYRQMNTAESNRG
jgi:hypothetical protein